jgi:hypothetical protein
MSIRSVARAFVALPLVVGCSREPVASFDAAPREAQSSKSAAPPPALAVPHFTDVLAKSGITFRHHFLDSESGSGYRVNPYDHGSGVFVADVNGDGLDDVYFLDFLGPAQLYLNRGGMKFEDVTAKAGVGLERAIKIGAAFGDYDGDGDVDLYVTTCRGGNHLFQNDGTGVFTDVTAKAGVGYTGHSSAATWFDYDLDGDLDLFVCNVGRFTVDTVSKEASWFYEGVALPFNEVVKTPDARLPGEGCILYRNEGNGTFHDATREAGVDAAEWNGDAAVADIDLDGDPDLYVSNMFGANHLLRNRGDGKFEDITGVALRRTSWGGMGARFFDADGDDYPDLYVVDMHSDMWIAPDERARIQPGAKFDTPLGDYPEHWKVVKSPDDTRASSVLFGNTFFHNRGNGTFDEASAQAHLETWWPWGIAAGDFDDDGAEDLFVPSGMGFPFFWWPNAFLKNDGSGVFTECAAAAGLSLDPAKQMIEGASIKGAPLAKSSRAAAVADFDGDGALDLVVANFNHEPFLYKNDAPHGHSLRLRLRDHAKAPAYGARVRVVAKSRTFSRQLANAQGYLTQSSATLHVGVGALTEVDRVEIFWPGSRTAQVVEHPKLDQVVTIDQL